jgi:hypothetical protein
LHYLACLLPAGWLVALKAIQKFELTVKVKITR